MKILLMALTLGVASAQIVNNGTGTGGSGGGTAPYVVPSFTGSPQTVTAATMLAAGKPQGPDARAWCWFSSAPSVAIDCTTANSNPAGSGDVTFSYGSNPTRVIIFTPGSGSQGATGATGSPGLGCGTLGGVLGGTCAAATLNNTAVTPGSYTNTNLTVGADGRITAATNGSGGGAGTASQLGDLSPVNTTSTRQTFGGSCSATTPCNLRVGNVLTSITAPVTVDISGTSSSDTIGYYLLNGTVFVGNNGAETLTCSSGCTTAGGFVANTFPPGSIPLWQTTLTANVWDTITNAMDWRAVYSTQNIKAGTGVGVVQSPTDGSVAVSVLPQQALAGFTSTGTKFTITGCSAGTTVGGASAGTFVSGTTGTCTVVITINGATGFTATNGWSCQVSDLTTGNLMRQTATSVTTCTVSGTTVSGDVISFIAIGY